MTSSPHQIAAALLMALNTSALSDSMCTIQDPWQFEQAEPNWPQADPSVREGECSGDNVTLAQLLDRAQQIGEPTGTAIAVDLNKDGTCEYFVSYPGMSGSGGTMWEIVSAAAPTPALGFIQAWGIAYLEPSNGFAQLETGDLSGGEYIKHLHAFRSGSYHVVRTNTYACDEQTGKWQLTETVHTRK